MANAGGPTVEVLASDLRNQPQIGRVLRARRKALGITQQDTARLAGVSPQWLSGFENGKGSCGLRSVMRVADALGVSLAVHERPVTDVDRVLEAAVSPAVWEAAAEDVDLPRREGPE